MTIATTSYAIVCDTEAEKNSLNGLYPSLVEATLCYCLDTSKTYKKTSGSWVQYQPDAAMQAQMDSLSALEGGLASWAAGMNTLVASKADSSSVSTLSGTVSSLAASLAGKYNTPSGTTSQYIRGDGSLASFPSIPSGQVQTDWNATSGMAQILNKPAQAIKVDAVSGSTSTSVVDVLGIQVATGAAITTLGTTMAEIKTKLNAVISGAKSNGWMATV